MFGKGKQPEPQPFTWKAKPFASEWIAYANALMEVGVFATEAEKHDFIGAAHYGHHHIGVSRANGRGR